MRNIVENLWVEDESSTVLGLSLSVRMTVVKMREGKLLLYSPISCTRLVRQKLEELGEVQYILAPNNHHKRWLLEWRQHYPLAELFVSEGAARKLNLHNYRILDEEHIAAWADEFERVFIAGTPYFNESALFHRESRSLFVTDLIQSHIENIPDGLAGLAVKFIWKPLGFWGLCFAPLLKWRFFIDDAQALANSIDAILALDFDKIILCRGEILEGEQVLMARKLLQGLKESQEK